jgi:hypothetical protein
VALCERTSLSGGWPWAFVGAAVAACYAETPAPVKQAIAITGFTPSCAATCPSSAADYVAVNISCLDHIELPDVTCVYWDGRHDN